MTFSIHDAPKIELPAGQIFSRVQRLKARKDSVQINGLLLPPTGIKAGRYCLAAGLTAYLADSPLTALYEAVFRREVKTFVALADLRQRSLATFKSLQPLRLVDLRGIEARYPVLVSQRIQHTQALAEQCHSSGFDGIVYASAQHPYHACVCLFETGARKLVFVDELALVKPRSNRLLTVVADAANKSGIEIT